MNCILGLYTDHEVESENLPAALNITNNIRPVEQRNDGMKEQRNERTNEQMNIK